MKAKAAIASASLTAALVACALGTAGRADATGTMRVQQSDGSVQTYSNVRIVIQNGDSMAVTSADGKGTVVIGKAACSKIGELIRCLPYDATLEQGGATAHIALKTGTVWLNPTASTQPLSLSSQQLPSHGVLLAVRTQAGTYVSLTGTIDGMKSK